MIAAWPFDSTMSNLEMAIALGILVGLFGRRRP